MSNNNEPVAWAVMLADGERIYDVYGIEEEARAIDEAVTGNHGVVPLYRSPSLTDAEQEFLQALHDAYQETANQTGSVNAAVQADSRKNAAIIRGLLERLGLIRNK